MFHALRGPVYVQRGSGPEGREGRGRLGVMVAVHETLGESELTYKTYIQTGA